MFSKKVASAQISFILIDMFLPDVIFFSSRMMSSLDLKHGATISNYINDALTTVCFKLVLLHLCPL